VSARIGYILWEVIHGPSEPCGFEIALIPFPVCGLAICQLNSPRSTPAGKNPKLWIPCFPDKAGKYGFQSN
jgi:hypothetical protein